MAVVTFAGVYIIIFTSLILSFSITLTRANLPSLSPGNKDTIKGQVCFRSSVYIQNALKDFSAIYSEWPKKPSTISSEYSPCRGMEASCCTLEKEQQIIQRMLLVEYNEKLQEAFEKRTATSCNKIGRHFERVLYTNIKESINILKTEVSGILHTQVSHELFQQLSDYLYKFVYTRDFCPLKENIVNQFKLLFRYTIQQMLSSQQQQQQEEDTNEDCLANLEAYYTSVWENDTIQYFMQSLNNIRLMEESFELTKSLITNLRSYKWQPECISALFTIRHCGYCVGYTNFQPCDGNCLNALRGCTADMAELDQHIRELRTQVMKIGHFIHNEFHPVKLVETMLFGYVKLTHQLTTANITHILMNTTSCQIDKEKEQKRLQQSVHTSLQYISANTRKRASANNQLLTAIQNDLKCTSDLESLLVQLPEEMCGIDPNHLAYIRKRECWNGTARGSYNEPIVGPYKSDQETNPSYPSAYNPLSLNNSLQHHINNIHLLRSDINRTLNYYKCYDQSDDEDCSIRFILSCQTPHPPPIEIEIGSGSGSGSGHGHPNGDIEKSKTNKESVVIELGGKRRFDDSGNHDDTTPILIQHSVTQATPILKTTPTQETTPIQKPTPPKSSSQIHTPSQITITSSAQTTPQTTPPVIILPNSPIVIIEPPPPTQPEKRGSSSCHIYSSLSLLIITLLMTLALV